jgi:hypothetical protein
MPLSLQPSATTQRLTTEILHRAFAADILPAGDLIAKLAQEGGPSALPALATFAASTRGKQLEEAAQAIAQISATIPLNQLLQLDAQLRAGARDASWWAVRADQVQRLSKEAESHAVLFGVLSCHGSGYVREAAVHALARQKSGAELPFLLMRVNDWVKPIQERAAQAVRERLVQSYVAHFAASMSLVHKLLIWRRADNRHLLDEIYRYLRESVNEKELASALHAADANSRGFIYRMLAESERRDWPALLNMALRDKAPWIRLWAARRGATDLLDDALREFVRVALRDRTAGVRVQAVYLVASHFPSDSKEWLTPLWMDPAASVRWTARYYTGGDVAACRPVYVQALASDSSIQAATAAMGLAEMGQKVDAALMIPLLRDPRPKVAAAATRALARLDGDNHIAELTWALLEGPPAVAREAEAALSKRAFMVDQQACWAAFEEAHSMVRKIRILRVLLQGGKWDALRYALLNLQSQVPEIAGTANSALSSWLSRFNQTWTQATPAQLEELRKLAVETRAAMRYGQYEWLVGLLQN